MSDGKPHYFSKKTERNLIMIAHLVVSLLIFVAAPTHADYVQLFPNALTQGEIQFLKKELALSDTARERIRRPVNIPNTLAHIIREQYLQQCEEPSQRVVFEDLKEENVIPINVLFETSPRHTDGLKFQGDRAFAEDMPGDLSVAFIPLEDNDQAFFDHGEERVLIKKGTMVTFDGAIKHNTVLLGGSVQFLGPFAWKRGKGFAIVSLNLTPAPTPKSFKAPSIKSTKAPAIKSTKAPTIKSTKAPTIKSSKAPTIKSSKAIV